MKTYWVDSVYLVISYLVSCARKTEGQVSKWSYALKERTRISTGKKIIVKEKNGGYRCPGYHNRCFKHII